MPKLTKSQQKVYDYLVGRTDDGTAPSVREICEATGFKSTSTVHAHLNSLEKLGLINRKSGCTRAIRVLGEEKTPKTAAVPIIGTVTAGLPIYAYEDNLGYVAVDESIKRGRELFALKVKGDSMINAGILNGDTAVFVRQSAAENGDIVAALLGEEATVKRFYKDKDVVRLQPENPLYEPIISDDVQILGKIVTLVRNYD